MATIWTAKVHKSGDRIQLLKNGSVTKVIRASDETFVPAEAQKFASGLVTNLNTRYAKQMQDPAGEITVATKGEEQKEMLKDVNTEAKGISPKEASAIQQENLNLKKRVAHLEKSAIVERKARRGLAIAKIMVEQKKIANTEDAIKAEVAKIAAMSNDEITLLERKTANQPLYESKDDAAKASRRYARMARLHRVAAEDAQLAGDEALADDEDERAAHYDGLSKQAADTYAQFDNTRAAITSEDAESQAQDTAKGVDAQGKKTASDEGDDKDLDTADEDVDDDMTDDVDEDALIEDELNVEAAVAIYKKIASNHKETAEKLTKEGKVKEAEVEAEIAKEAEELADSMSDDDDDDDVDFSKEAASIYKKIAAEHRKKADELEAAGKIDEADVEDEIADESDELAQSVEASDDSKKCSEDDAKKDDACAAAPAVAPAPAAAAAPAEVPAAVTDESKVSSDDKGKADAVKATDDMSDILKGADESEDAAKKDDDPLAALLGDDEKEASETADDSLDDKDMPSDEEIAAAVSNEDYEDIDEGTDKESKVKKTGDDSDDDADANDDAGDDDDDSTKDAASEGTKKIANVGHDKYSTDRHEENQFADDPQVRELEEGLWGDKKIQ